MSTKDDTNVSNEETSDDVVFEDTDEAKADATIKVKKLKDELKKCLEEKQTYLDGWQRAKAELINARKRDDEARAEFLKFAKEDVILELVPVLDSFQMAFSNKEAWEKADKNWRMGVEYIHTQLQSILQKNGLSEINPLGETYNPSVHEAIEMKPTESSNDDGKIISVINKGYQLNGKVIRPPKVTVGEKK